MTTANISIPHSSTPVPSCSELPKSSLAQQTSRQVSLRWCRAWEHLSQLLRPILPFHPSKHAQHLGSSPLFWCPPILSLLCPPTASTFISACAPPSAPQHLPPITSGKSWALLHHIFPPDGEVPAPSWSTQTHSRISPGNWYASLRRAIAAGHHCLGPSVLHSWLCRKFNLFSRDLSNFFYPFPESCYSQPFKINAKSGAKFKLFL